MEEVQIRLNIEQRRHIPLKIYLTVRLNYTINDEPGIIAMQSLNTDSFIILISTDTENVKKELQKSLLRQLHEYENNNLGWKFLRFEEMYLNLVYFHMIPRVTETDQAITNI